MNMKKIGVVVVSSLLLAVTSLASANEVIIGGAVGQAQVKDYFTEEQLLSSGADQADVTDSGTAFKVYVGTEMNENIVLRAGFAGLPDIELVASDSSPLVIAEEIKTSAVFADLLAQAKPAEQLALYVKLGAAAVLTKQSYAELDGVDFSSSLEEKTSIVFVPGVGVAFEPTKKLGITLEAERYLGVSPYDGLDIDVDVFSAGLYVKF